MSLALALTLALTRARRQPGAARPAALLALVLALHLLGLLLASRLGAWRDRHPPHAQPAPLVLQLLHAVQGAVAPAPLPAAARSVVRSRARPALPPSESSDMVQPPPAAQAQQAITLPAEPSAAAASSPHNSPLPSPPPLDLRLPGGPQALWRSGRNPARDDPRANTRRPLTLDARLTAALGGSDAISEEVLSDGSLRLRRGSSCVIARPNRGQALNPFNASVSPAPRLIDAC